MAYIFVNKSRLRTFAQQSRQIESKIKNINNDFSSTGRSLDWDIKSASDINNIISQIGNELDKYARTFNKVSGFFETAYSEYTKLDAESMSDTDMSASSTTVTASSKSIYDDLIQWFRDKPIRAIYPLGLINPLIAPMLLPFAGKDFLDMWDYLAKKDGGKDSLFKNEKNIGEYGKVGTYGLGYEATDKVLKAYAGKASAQMQKGNASAEVNAYVGKVETKKDFKLNLWGDQSEYKEKPEDKTEDSRSKFIGAKANIGASASVLSADGTAKIGDDMGGVKVVGTGDLLKAAATGGINLGYGSKESIDQDGVQTNDTGITAVAKGELMVAAVQGEAKGTISILGLDITGTIGGKAGALGVEGKLGIENGKFDAKIGAAALLGGSAGIEIGFNKTGWKNTVKGAENLYQGAKDFYSGTKDFIDAVV